MESQHFKHCGTRYVQQRFELVGGRTRHVFKAIKAWWLLGRITNTCVWDKPRPEKCGTIQCQQIVGQDKTSNMWDKRVFDNVRPAKHGTKPDGSRTRQNQQCDRGKARSAECGTRQNNKVRDKGNPAMYRTYPNKCTAEMFY